MNQGFLAIYEHGVLRPLAPLDLPESATVTVVLRETEKSSEVDGKPNSIELRKQQESLDAMFELVDKMPQQPCNDGLSGRAHDRILYGDKP